MTRLKYRTDQKLTRLKNETDQILIWSNILLAIQIHLERNIAKQFLYFSTAGKQWFLLDEAASVMRIHCSRNYWKIQELHSFFSCCENTLISSYPHRHIHPMLHSNKHVRLNITHSSIKKRNIQVDKAWWSHKMYLKYCLKGNDNVTNNYKQICVSVYRYQQSFLLFWN